MSNTSTRGNNALNKARNASATKLASAPQTSTDTKVFQGVVVEVRKGSDGEPFIQTKSNGSEYMTCKVELDIMHPQTGKPIVLAAVRTLPRTQDENGDPLLDEDGNPTTITNSEVVEGQNVTLYVRMVDGVKYADISTGSTDNSDDAVNEVLGF